MPTQIADTSSQTPSSSFLLPVEDVDFLLRDEMRALRFALEYAKAEFLIVGIGNHPYLQLRDSPQQFSGVPHGIARRHAGQ